jgi:hypothetical protein
MAGVMIHHKAVRQEHRDARGRAALDLITYLLIGFAAWTAIVVVVLAMCKAAARADARIEPVCAPSSPSAASPSRVLVGQR